MKSMRNAHIVVVGDCGHGRKLAARLRRMAVARVTEVPGLAEARALCQRGDVHACIVVSDELSFGWSFGLDLDRASPAIADAPGRGSGVPSMIMVPAVTAYVCKTARRDGYMAALPANIAASVLYRRIGAALQHRPGGLRGARRRKPSGPGLPVLVSGARAPEAKPTLH